MAKNGKSGDNHLNGAVKSFSQTFNSNTRHLVKINTNPWQFIDIEIGGKIFNGGKNER